jgi:protein ImuB
VIGMAVSRTLPLFPSLAPPQPQRKRVQPKLAPAARQPPGPEPEPRASARRLWLAIHFSSLALDALHEKRAQPLAVIDVEDRQQAVLACSSAARRAGVRSGHALNAALALVPELVTVPRDARRERELLERIAAWCHRFTPIVSLEGDEELLLEVKGSVHLFGGIEGLMERVTNGLGTQELDVRLALAPTSRGALWLSRENLSSSPSLQPSPRLRGERERELPSSHVTRVEDLARCLAPLSLHCLRWPDDVLERLVDMGVRNVGDLLRLPRAGLARRIGAAWLADLDRALGRAPEVRRPFRAPQRYDDRWSLDSEVETVAGLTQVIEPLLERLQRFLRARGAAIGSLILELGHRTEPLSRVRIGLAAPTGDVAHLRGLLRERLAALALRAPVRVVRLRSGALLDAIGSSANLPNAGSAAGQADALPRFIERLHARLGRERVFGVGLFAEHRPELAWRAIEMLRAQSSADTPCLSHRPLWLLAEPELLQTPLPSWRIESGPERVESGWWDGDDVTRDYYVACDPHGARCWIYRERSAPHRWFLHGLFG